MSYDGTLIAVEGLDGSGKSTVVEGIEHWADDEGVDLVTTAEPTDFQTGDWLYEALGDEEGSALTDFMLFCADRRRHVQRRVKPVLDRGGVVVTDRYADSTRAYQTHQIAAETDMSYDEARDWMETVFDPSRLSSVDEAEAPSESKGWNVEPDIVIYIDVPVDIALDRCDTDDKFERRKNLERAKEAYDDMYSICDPSVRIIDGTQSISAVRHKAINTVKAQLHEPDSTHSRERAESRERTYADALGREPGGEGEAEE